MAEFKPSDVYERGDFSKRIHKEALPTIRYPRTKEGRKKMHERFMADLLGERLPDAHLPIEKFSDREKYLIHLHRKFYEVVQCIERMHMCEKFIKSNQKTFSQIDYVRYHFEFFLNEIYIFSERFNALLNFVISKCRKKGLVNEAGKAEEFKKRFNTALQRVVLIRGSHVHQTRYRSDKLDQVNLLSSVSEGFDFIKEYRDMEFKELKKMMIKDIREVRTKLHGFLEFDLNKALKTVVFVKLKQRHRGYYRGKAVKKKAG